MVRTQIQLPEEQHRQLKAEAHRRGTSMAAVVRDLVARGLASDGSAKTPRRYEALLAMIGCGRDTATDVAENHDKYLADILYESHR
jgi:plasmid stability protein